MKRLIFYLIAMVVWVTAYATNNVNLRQGAVPGVPESPIKSEIIKGATLKTDVKRIGEETITRGGTVEPEEEEDDPSWIDVTFTFPTLGEEWFFLTYNQAITVYNEEGYSKIIEVDQFDRFGNFTGITSVTTRLPKGTYDCIADFIHIDPEVLCEGYMNPIFYIVENLIVEDACKVELHPEKSTVCLNMEPSLPGGEKMKFRKIIHYGEDDFDIVEEGNIWNDHNIKLILFKGTPVYYAETGVPAVEYVGASDIKHDPYIYHNFYVNPVSDNYIFRMVNLICPFDLDKGLFIAATECLGGKEGIYTNSDYIHDDSQITPQPSISSIQDYIADNSVLPYILQINLYCDPHLYKYGDEIAYDTPHYWDNIWSSGPEKPINDNYLYFCYRKGIADGVIEYPERGYNEYFETLSSHYFPLAKEGVTLACFPFGKLGVDESDMSIYQTFPGNSTYSTLLENLNLQIGGSAPLLISYISRKYDKAIRDYFKYFDGGYTGRVNGNILTDEALANCIIKLEDKEVFNGILNDVEEWMKANRDCVGQIEIDLSTQNFEIDGLKGGNNAVIRYNNTKEDAIPPTVTMMQFRNKEGKVAQQFATANDGEILLSAAELTLLLAKEPNKNGLITSWYGFSEPAKVVVTCKPYGSDLDTFDKIELTVQPELFQTGFGAMYKGSLADVTLKSETCWFDLTINVEDALGNSQTQTISPAFKIESLSGTKGLNDNEEIRVTGNSIITDLPVRIYNLNGLQVSGSNLSSGIYFVVFKDKAIKVLI